MMEILFDQTRQDRIRDNAILAQGIGIGRDEGIEEGIGIGEAKGELSMLNSLVLNKLITKDVAAAQLGISVEEFDKRVAEGQVASNSK